MGLTSSRSSSRLGGMQFRYELGCDHVKLSGIVPPVPEGKTTFCWRCGGHREVIVREPTGKRSVLTYPT
jgi:hypothetical protein